MRPGAKRGVLIVDDVADTRELLAELFTHLGYHSMMANNGVEALARLREIRPDVIISDLMMEEMGGAVLIRHIDEDERLAGIPIILLTGSGKPKALEDLGAQADRVKTILTKPVSLVELQEAVGAAISDGAGS
ncbi:MAG: two-component response regulator [Myxococcales bacterium]|nr:two-component response regulator [Myxococcales bacterium]